MALKLIYITNDTAVATSAQNSGVDWILVDLEVHGKAERQSGRNTVISAHSVDDVRRVRAAVRRAALVVRVNPIGTWSNEEIDRVVQYGADIIMLPFFKTAGEVSYFLDCVKGRAKTCLLVETPDAVANIDSILDTASVDYIHIGLNDLHIAYGMRFMFEPLANGTVDWLCGKIAKKSIQYGFGGVARIGRRSPPAESIIAEHYRLGSTMVILSRSFCNAASMASLEDIDSSFRNGVAEIRSVETALRVKSDEFFRANREYVRREIIRVAVEGETIG